MLHWRVGLNPHHMVKGSGTWTAEEDERLSKLVEVVGMKVRFCFCCSYSLMTNDESAFVYYAGWTTSLHCSNSYGGSERTRLWKSGHFW